MAEKVVLYEADIDFDQVIKDVETLRKKTAELKAESDKYRGTAEENTAAHIKAQAAYKAEATELRTQEGLLVKLTTANKQSVGTLAELEAANKKLRIEQKTLNLTTEEGVKRNLEINKTINRNTEIIKENVDQSQKQKMAIGDYAQSLSGLGTPIGGVINGLLGMAKAAWAFVSTPLGAVLAAIVAVGTLVYNLFKKFEPVLDRINQVIAAMVAAFNVLKNAFIGFITGNKNLNESFNGLGKAMKDAAIEAKNLKMAQQALDDANILLLEHNAKYKRQIDELLLQSKDRTKTEKERIALIDEALKIEQKAFEERKRLIDEEYRIKLETVINKNNLTDEEKAKARELGAEYLLQLSITKQISKDEIKDLSETAAKREQIINESIAIREKAMIRQNVLIEKTEEEELKAQEKAAERRKKAEAEKAEAEKKELAEAKKRLDETINNLEIDLKTYLLTSENKLKRAEQLTQELINEEIKRQEKINRLEKEALDLQLENKLITQREYDYAILEQQTNLNNLKTDLQLEYEEQERDRLYEQQLLDHENEMAVAEGNLFAELELKKQWLEKEEQQEIAAAQKLGANVLLIEKKYSKAKQALARAEFNAKLALAKGFTENIAVIAGEQTAIGKAAAVASTTITTLQSAVSSFQDFASTGTPAGYGLGIVAAGAALVAGYAQVKSILSVKSGLPGDSSKGGSVPSSGAAMQSMPSVSREMTSASVGAGIVSRESNDFGSDSVASGVSKALQDNPIQPTLVIDDVTNNQYLNSNMSKTATL